MTAVLPHDPLHPSLLPSDPAGTDTAADFREYAYSVSHDLGGPIRAMVEFAKLLRAEEARTLSPEAQDYLALIVESGHQLQAMLNGLLQFSRLNTAAQPFTHAPLDMLVRRAARAARLQAPDVTLDIGSLPQVYGDPAQLEMLFTQLLDNAAKFRAPGDAAAIRINCAPAAGGYEIRVEDNGIGVAPEFRDKIFRPFQRLHTDEEYEGVGMGLTLARKIVARHGGRLWHESAPGRGSVFVVSLPSAPVAAAPRPVHEGDSDVTRSADTEAAARSAG